MVLPDQLVAPQITSTPISSNIGILLRWYTEDMQEILLQTKEAKFQETSQISDITKKQSYSFEGVSGTNQPSCSQVIDDKITDLLRLPEYRKGTKRMRTKSPAPLAISSKKFKEYLELK